MEKLGAFGLAQRVSLPEEQQLCDEIWFISFTVWGNVWKLVSFCLDFRMKGTTFLLLFGVVLSFCDAQVSTSAICTYFLFFCFLSYVIYIPRAKMLEPQTVKKMDVSNVTPPTGLIYEASRWASSLSPILTVKPHTDWLTNLNHETDLKWANAPIKFQTSLQRSPSADSRPLVAFRKSADFRYLYWKLHPSLISLWLGLWILKHVWIWWQQHGLKSCDINNTKMKHWWKISELMR